MKQTRCIFLLLAWLPFMSMGANLKPFHAEYDIFRDGKKSATQTTNLTQNTNGQWVLTDQTKGTSGLASLVGFKRKEITTFNWANSQISVISHQMNQKAAFSKKQFNYAATDQGIKGKHKGKSFTLAQSDNQLVPSHAMPLLLATQSCLNQTQGSQKMSIAVLKSNQPKNYHFEINHQKPLIEVNRVYPPQSTKSTQSWLDPAQGCLPQRQLHQDGDDPSVETRLKSLRWD